MFILIELRLSNGQIFREGCLLEGGVYSDLNANDAAFMWGPVLIRNAVSGVKT